MSINLWNSFQKRNQLSEKELGQFQKYYELLSEWGQKINLTTIKDLAEVLDFHFQDSLALGSAMDLKDKSLADVGTGAGFPGIPLKIKYPDLKLILIEVVGKKVAFLSEVIKQLELENVQIVQIDWRTFLRSSEIPIQIFTARASVRILELLRIFKPASKYKKNSTLVYWASEKSFSELKTQPLIEKSYEYEIENQKRFLIFFKQ